MKKFLLAVTLVLATACNIVSPAEAGNSVRVKGPMATGGTGGGVQPPLCPTPVCDAGDADLVVWDDTNQCYDCIECTDNQILAFDTATDTWVCESGGTLCNAAGCTNGDFLYYDTVNDCNQCLTCTDEQMTMFDTATNAWVCVDAGAVCSSAACVDGDFVYWNSTSACYDCLTCTDEQMTMYDSGTSAWVCVDAGNLCVEATCADNSIIQYNTTSSCYDCLICTVTGEVLTWTGTDWACVAGPTDPAGAGCLDDTAGDLYVLDDFEVGDDAYISDAFRVNTCDLSWTYQADNGNTEVQTPSVVIANNVTGTGVDGNWTAVLEAHQSGLDEVNELAFARYYDVGAGDITTVYGYDAGSIWGYVYDGTDVVRQAGIAFQLSSDDGHSGTMTASDGHGSISFRHHDGVNSAYATSAFAQPNLDWEFFGDVYLNTGWLGWGGITAGAAACIIDDGSDRLFHDTNCDDTKDAGEEFIDQKGGSDTFAYKLSIGDITLAYASSPGLGVYTGTNYSHQTLSFDQTTPEYIQINVPLPTDVCTLAGCTTTFSIYTVNTGVAANSVVWDITWVPVADGESWDTAGTNATVTQAYLADSTTVEIVTWTFAQDTFVAADMLHVRLHREAADGADTLAGDVRMYGGMAEIEMAP